MGNRLAPRPRGRGCARLMGARGHTARLRHPPSTPPHHDHRDTREAGGATTAPSPVIRLDGIVTLEQIDRLDQQQHSSNARLTRCAGGIFQMNRVLVVSIPASREASWAASEGSVDWTHPSALPSEIDAKTSRENSAYSGVHRQRLGSLLDCCRTPSESLHGASCCHPRRLQRPLNQRHHATTRAPFILGPRFPLAVVLASNFSAPAVQATTNRAVHRDCRGNREGLEGSFVRVLKLKHAYNATKSPHQ